MSRPLRAIAAALLLVVTFAMALAGTVSTTVDGDDHIEWIADDAVAPRTPPAPPAPSHAVAAHPVAHAPDTRGAARSIVAIAPKTSPPA